MVHSGASTYRSGGLVKIGISCHLASEHKGSLNRLSAVMATHNATPATAQRSHQPVQHARSPLVRLLATRLAKLPAAGEGAGSAARSGCARCRAAVRTLVSRLNIA